MAQQLNVLLFFTDDQRFDALAAAGNDEIHTPNLDALAERGTRFAQAHIPGGTSPAVCMPSRAMLHTGRTLFHIQGEGQSIPKEHPTLGECLKQAGYETFGTGKWHNGRDAFARSFTDGDEIFFGGMGDHWNVPAYRFDPAGGYDERCPIVHSPHNSNTVEYRQCDHITAGQHSTELFVDATSDFLQRRDTSKPFFAYVSLMAPHDPRTMPEKFRKMYDPASIELPANFMGEHPIDTGALAIRDEMLAAFPRDPEEVRRHIAEYYAMISHLDDAFGRLIDSLKEEGVFENTIIVFAGDNGLAVGQHGLLGKQNLYDHSVRVPLIMAGPGVSQGVQSKALVYLLDIYPTLCDLLGIDTPDSVEGKSLVPYFSEANASCRDTLYLAYGSTIRGVRKENMKLIEYVAGRCRTTQLFDVENDPHEMHNLAHEPAMAELREKLTDELFRLRDEWDDCQHSTGEAFWKRYALL